MLEVPQIFTFVFSCRVKQMRLGIYLVLGGMFLFNSGIVNGHTTSIFPINRSQGLATIAFFELHKRDVCNQRRNFSNKI